MSERPPAATLGIEIELPWTVMLDQVHQTSAAKILRESEGFYSLPDDEKAIVQKGFDRVDERYKSKVKQANDMGIPSVGNDGFTEFALHPRDNPRPILREVDTLYELGLLSDKRYPLHITVGHIGSTASAAYLLCSMEIMGDTRPERITQKNTWNVKGRGGVKRRFARELSLGATKGVELRTLELYNRTQLRDVLATAHSGAQGIIDKDPLWLSWRNQLQDMLEQEGLPTNAFWDRSDAATWEKYADLLNNNTWRSEAKHIIGRHAALLTCLKSESHITQDSTDAS